MKTWDCLKKRGCGYSTGSCAAAAAKAAASALFSGHVPPRVQIDLPNGVLLDLDIEEPLINNGCASCAVRKYSGNDPDVTDGLLIFASVQKNHTERVNIFGGKGIGIAVRPGLSIEVGEAAINPVPRKMIVAETGKVCGEYGYRGGLDIIISAPLGEAAAEKTFNRRLGIEGGISILGTSGIVEPMSEKAIVDTIYLELKQRAVLGEKNLIIAPGNYGRDYMKAAWGIDVEKAVKCSNFIGEAIDFASEWGFDSLLLVGHAGKLVKLAAGVMNTHSKTADVRMEVFALYAALCGADKELIQKLLDCISSENAIGILRETGLLRQVSGKITVKIEEHLARRAGGHLKTAAVVFTNTYGLFGKTSCAEELIREVHLL